MWKILRDRYVREKKKKDTLRAGVKVITDVTTWPYMANISFLTPYVEPRITYTSIRTFAKLKTIITSSGIYILLVKLHLSSGNNREDDKT